MPVTVVAGVDTPVNVNLGDLPAGISVGVTFMGKSVNACRVSIADAGPPPGCRHNSGSDSFRGPGFAWHGMTSGVTTPAWCRLRRQCAEWP